MLVWAHHRRSAQTYNRAELIELKFLSLYWNQRGAGKGINFRGCERGVSYKPFKTFDQPDLVRGPFKSLPDLSIPTEYGIGVRFSIYSFSVLK